MVVVVGVGGGQGLVVTFGWFLTSDTESLLLQSVASHFRHRMLGCYSDWFLTPHTESLAVTVTGFSL